MAGYDYIGAIMAFEDGQMDRDGAVELLTYLRDNGMLNSMQGWC